MRLVRHYFLLVLLFCGLRSLALGGDFYQQFLSLVDTNKGPVALWDIPALVDTNNPGIKVTNSALDLASLRKRGEVSGVRLGMTMQEAIERLGKPHGGWSHPGCLHGLTTFFYGDLSLGFEGNRLETIHISLDCRPEIGLSVTSGVVRVLGAPASRRGAWQHSCLAYISPTNGVRLDFHEDRLFGVWLEHTPLRAEHEIARANPQGGANGEQPGGSQTNRTSAPTAPRRSP
jgi:hypothetical protein